MGNVLPGRAQDACDSFEPDITMEPSQGSAIAGNPRSNKGPNGRSSRVSPVFPYTIKPNGRVE